MGTPYKPDLLVSFDLFLVNYFPSSVKIMKMFHLVIISKICMIIVIFNYVLVSYDFSLNLFRFLSFVYKVFYLLVLPMTIVSRKSNRFHCAKKNVTTTRKYLLTQKNSNNKTEFSML